MRAHAHAHAGVRSGVMLQHYGSALQVAEGAATNLQGNQQQTVPSTNGTIYIPHQLDTATRQTRAPLP